MQPFSYFTQLLSTKYLQELCSYVLDDSKFAKGYGSASGSHQHHTYVGGLYIHTLEVLNLAYLTASQFDDANLDVIIVAAIFHDYMKVLEYSPHKGTIVKTPYRKLIRHVAGSYAEFQNRVSNYTYEEIPEDLQIQIGHCILTHHGNLEAGSPVEPQTLEARIIHQADMLSSLYGPGKESNAKL